MNSLVFYTVSYILYRHLNLYRNIDFFKTKAAILNCKLFSYFLSDTSTYL